MIGGDGGGVGVDGVEYIDGVGELVPDDSAGA